jgi:hypothetical protein
VYLKGITLLTFGWVGCFFLGSSLHVRPAAGQTSANGCQVANNQVTALELQIERDQAAIRSLGFSQQASDIEQWMQLSEQARTKFMSTALDMLVANAIEGVKAGGSLNPPSANIAISKLRAVGIDSVTLNDAIRRVGSTPGKPPAAKDILFILNSLQKLKDSYEISKTKRSDLNSILEALSTVLGWVETDSQLGYMATDLQFTTSSVYNNLTRRVSLEQINKLTSLAEKDLQSLKLLSEQLRTDVRKQNAARASLAECQSHNEGPDYCAAVCANGPNIVCSVGCPGWNANNKSTSKPTN